MRPTGGVVRPFGVDGIDAVELALAMSLRFCLQLPGTIEAALSRLVGVECTLACSELEGLELPFRGVIASALYWSSSSL